MKTCGQCRHGHHSSAHQFVLDLAGESTLSIQDAVEISDQRGQFMTHRPNIAGSFNQFAR